jgi:hypothetical protein
MPEPKTEPLYKFLPLPPGFAPLVCTIEEARSYDRCSRWTAHQKLRQGRRRFFKDGRITKVIFASVVEDMERTMADGGGRPIEPVEKRRPGRPRKHPTPEQTASAGE